MDDDKTMDEIPKQSAAKGGGMPPEMKAKADSLHQETVSRLGEAPAADRPLSPDRVMRLAEALESAVEELGNGEVEGLEVPAVDGPVDQLPPALFAGLKTIRAALDEIGGKAASAYDFSPDEAAASDQGLEVAISQLSKMSKDTRLLSQLQGGGKPPAKREPTKKQAPPEPKKDVGYDDMIGEDEEM